MGPILIDIREARKEDCKDIRNLIQALADSEKMPDGPKINEATLEKDGFLTNPPLFKSFVADDDGKIVGYAIYYYTYSTWEGKSMFLADLYVSPEYRKKSVGSRLFDAVAKVAAQEDCCRLEFLVLDWNPANELYKHKGAANLTKEEGWNHYRLDSQALKKKYKIK